MAPTSTDIVNEIRHDHKTLKNLFKKGLNEDASLGDKKEIFEELAIVVIAHSKAEEGAMYAPTCRIDETKNQAYQGFEEHGLVELLIEEMKSESNDDKWNAKFTVMCELLEHHVEEEEEEYLPLIDEVCSQEERRMMGKEYRETYDHLEAAQRQIVHPFSDDKFHMRNH